MMTLGELLNFVGGRTPMLIELKSRFDGNLRLVERAAAVLKTYAGPFAVMSFDPEPIIALRTLAPAFTRGIVAERSYDDTEWRDLTDKQKRSLAFLLHAPRSQPHFIAYQVSDLPSPGPWIARNLFGRPLLAWTVRTDAERERAKRRADQMIFEGFRP
jgi:glycerophosphoryl diester phosphodiesterase